MAVEDIITRTENDARPSNTKGEQKTARLDVAVQKKSEVIHVVAKGKLPDITARMIRDQTRNSGENSPLIIEITPLAPWEFYAEKNMFEFDDEFYAIYGTSVAREGRFMTSEVYAREFVHPDDAWIVEAAVARLLSFTERYISGQIEHRIIRRDGEVRNIVVRANILRDRTGKIIKWYGANQDITGQKAMEEALRLSREKLSLAVELAHLGPWEYNPEMNLFEFNDEFYAIYGTDVAREGRFMAPEVYAGEFVHPDDAWMVVTEVKKALLTKERHYSTQIEHRIIRRDGEVRTIAVRVNIIRDAAGKVLKWYGANQDITEQKRAEEVRRQKTEEIRRMAYTDVLTGLSNRAYLNERLREELKKARRGESSGAVLFVDLDDLKTVNDTLGHTYGDVIIIEAGRRLVEEAGKGAYVGRIGGDEFLAIMPGLKNRQEIGRTVNRIVNVLCQDTEVFGELFHLSASIGVAVYPDDGNTAEEILKNADNAMYAAKNAGKSCWRFYDSRMQEEAYEKMVLTKSLRQAIKRRELLVYYQPQVTVADGKTVGFEALLRWNSQEHGGISPARFIPLAEQSGLIQPIGNWVLREACQFARRLADRGWGNIYVSVNISPHQLGADDFVCSVRNALNSAGIKPCQLELEITENALISSINESVCRLHELRAMGVRLALDDFGKGYSSLTYLQRLPVTTLKIDKFFVDMILKDETQKAIIRTIVDMAHAMKMLVVAEGVETKGQIDYLAQCRCDLFQGFIISLPVPEDDVVQFCSDVPQRE